MCETIKDKYLKFHTLHPSNEHSRVIIISICFHLSPQFGFASLSNFVILNVRNVIFSSKIERRIAENRHTELGYLHNPARTHDAPAKNIQISITFKCKVLHFALRIRNFCRAQTCRARIHFRLPRAASAYTSKSNEAFVRYIFPHRYIYIYTYNLFLLFLHSVPLSSVECTRG